MEKKHNTEQGDLFKSPNIVNEIKRSILESTAQVWKE